MSSAVLLLDVTAMAADGICVAGLDMKRRRMVRLNEPQPTERLRKLLGCVEPGFVVRVDYRPVRKPPAPHIEDCEWQPHSLKRERRATLEEITEALRPTTLQSVVEAFGPSQTSEESKNSGWAPGSGSRSLATIQATSVRVEANSAGRARIVFTDKERRWSDVPFQDLIVRQHRDTCPDCQSNHLPHLRQDFEADEALVRIGLTRPYAPEGSEPVCWLQVTNILAKPREHFV